MAHCHSVTSNGMNLQASVHNANNRIRLFHELFTVLGNSPANELPYNVAWKTKMLGSSLLPQSVLHPVFKNPFVHHLFFTFCIISPFQYGLHLGVNPLLARAGIAYFG